MKCSECHTPEPMQPNRIDATYVVYCCEHCGNTIRRREPLPRVDEHTQATLIPVLGTGTGK